MLIPICDASKASILQNTEPDQFPAARPIWREITNINLDAFVCNGELPCDYDYGIYSNNDEGVPGLVDVGGNIVEGGGEGEEEEEGNEEE